MLTDQTYVATAGSPQGEFITDHKSLL
jgi:hypothetical protein